MWTMTRNMALDGFDDQCPYMMLHDRLLANSGLPLRDTLAGIRAYARMGPNWSALYPNEIDQFPSYLYSAAYSSMTPNCQAARYFS